MSARWAYLRLIRQILAYLPNHECWNGLLPHFEFHQLSLCFDYAKHCNSEL
jgi:hypothetical protein